jgi:hypothetical protein
MVAVGVAGRVGVVDVLNDGRRSAVQVMLVRDGACPFRCLVASVGEVLNE